MNAAAASAASSVAQPGELERRRLLRGLQARARYRYVQPRVLAEGNGWRVVSPCCSRSVDPEGGVIDIAWFEPLGRRGWRLHSRDHRQGCWVKHAEAFRLDELLALVRDDPLGVFWP